MLGTFIVEAHVRQALAGFPNADAELVRAVALATIGAAVEIINEVQALQDDLDETTTLELVRVFQRVEYN
jgi:hypothetical protein